MSKPVGKDTWDGGWILDPEKNAKYSVELKPIGTDKLRVVGYMGSKLFSETMTWKRAPPDLKRCDEVASTEGEKSAPSAGGAPAAKSDASPKNPTGEASKEKATPRHTGCTKYVPQIGQTVEVPCPR